MILYDVGDTTTLRTTAFDADGDGIAPDSITLTLTEPDGTVSTPVPTNPSVGDYQHDQLLDMGGVWRYRWVTTGDNAQVDEGVLLVGGPQQGPARWIDARDVFDGTRCSSVEDDDRNYALADRSALIASYILWALSGRQFPGVFVDTIRPCRSEQVSDIYRFRHERGWWSASRPWGSCGCGTHDSCGCGGLSQLTMPGKAVLGIFEVKLDGEVLDPSEYRVDDNKRLVRLGNERWPCCQDLGLADTEPDTFSVSYAFGRVPPEAGLQAARELACELYKGALTGDCALPKRVTSVSRQGMSMVVLDPFNFFDKGRTGLYMVDLFLAAVNPGKSQRPVVVRSPDVPGARGVRTDT